MTEGEPQREVRYSLPQLPLERQQRWLYLAIAGLAVVGALTRHSWRPVYVGAICLGLMAAMWLVRRGKSREFVADSDRISRPVLGADIRWSDVECVIAPSRYDGTVRVRMKNGHEEPTGFPRQYAEQLAEIGHRPLRERRDLEDERGR